MSSSALILMVSVWSIVTFATIYFFWLVVKTPPKEETDSFTDNDPK